MTDTQLGALFFLQLGVILIVCRLVGWCAVRMGQPQVVAEMVAGFLMGPSFFGWVAPTVQAALFPAPTLHAIFVVSQIGLVLYMFCVGLEFRPDLMLKHGRSAAAVSVAGIVVPFTLGGALALWLLPAGGFFAEQVRPAHAVLFVGAAMSITAFPMLARIIDERGIAGTALGTLTLAAGALDDAAAWIILAVVLGSFSGSTTLAISAALGGLFYVVVVLLVARPLLRKLDTAAEADGRMAPWMLTSILSALAIGAWFTDTVGIYAVFGAFAPYRERSSIERNRRTIRPDQAGQPEPPPDSPAGGRREPHGRGHLERLSAAASTARSAWPRGGAPRHLGCREQASRGVRSGWRAAASASR